jgi:hypothetical protein
VQKVLVYAAWQRLEGVFATLFSALFAAVKPAGGNT